MIKAIRKRAQPDNLKNQIRAGGQSFARRLYLWSIGGVIVILLSALLGPLLFLDADALVMRERSIISPDYNARIVSVEVKPGDMVAKGQLLMRISSSETLDRIAELTSKVGQLSTRETQLTSRARQIEMLAPALRERRRRAEAAVRDLKALAQKQLTTSIRINEAPRSFSTPNARRRRSPAKSTSSRTRSRRRPNPGRIWPARSRR